MSSIFIGRGIRRSDEEVVKCAELIANGFTILGVEQFLGIPHSTISWTIKHRLPRLDYSLYKKCIVIYRQHIEEGRRKGGRAGRVTKSN